MKQLQRRILIILIMLSLIIGNMPVSIFAVENKAPLFSDWPEDWSSEALQAAVDNGLIMGYNGKIMPDNQLTRAEMAAIINRAFGAVEMGSLAEFTDIPDNAWYKTDLAKALHMGTFMGSGGGLMRPEDPITREEVFVVICRAFRLEPAKQNILYRFTDQADVSSWAIPEVAAMVASGYVQGDGSGLNPRANITRKEFAQLMHNLVKTYIKQPGIVNKIPAGNVLINAPYVVLKNVTIYGDLIIGYGAAKETITLENVTVTGRIINRSGANIVYNNDADNTNKDLNKNTNKDTDDNIPPDSTSKHSKNLTVFFETNGGSIISPVSLKHGSLLTSLPIPSKVGYAFTGWYTNKNLTDPFYVDVPIMENMTLYADYGEKDYNLEEYTDPNKYIEDCSDDFEITIISPVALNTSNLENYLDMVSYASRDIPPLGVRVSGNKYIIKPSEPYYEAGSLYVFSLKDENLFFDNQQNGVRVLSFRIFKEETKIVEFQEGIIDVLWEDTEDIGEGNYMVPGDKYGMIKTAYDAKTLSNNRKSEPDLSDESVILRFWNGSSGDETLEYRKVTNLSYIEGKEETTDTILLHTDSCQPGEVYEEIDVYGKDLMSAGALLEAAMDLDTDKIAEQAKNGEGAIIMASLLKESLAHSPTIKALLDDPGEEPVQLTALSFEVLLLSSSLSEESSGFRKPGEGNTKVDIPVKFIDVKGLNVTCTIGGSDNANFNLGENYAGMTREKWAKEYPQLANEYPNIWPVLTLRFEYEAVIKNRVQVNAVFEIKELLTASLQGWSKYGGKLQYPSTWDDLSFDYALNVYSQTDIGLTVMAKSVDKSEEFKYEIDITEEIKKLIDGEEDDEDGENPADILKKVLGDKGDYIKIVEAEITKVTVSVLDLVEFEFELNFVVSVNFAAGISSKLTYLTAQQFGIKGDLDKNEAGTYNHPLGKNGLFEFDMYAAGYFGVKAGINGSAAVSVIGLKDVGKVGASLELGVYLDAYGFAHLNIHQTNETLFSNPDGTWRTAKPIISISGAIYMEIGIYVEMDIFFESKILSLKLEAPIFEYKLPLLAMGDRYILVEFENNSDRIIVTKDELPLIGAGGLIEAKYLDITTGEILTGNYGRLDRFNFQFTTPCFSVKDNKIVVNKEAIGTGTTRADSKVIVYYTGGALFFNKPGYSIDLGSYNAEKTVFPAFVKDSYKYWSTDFLPPPALRLNDPNNPNYISPEKAVDYLMGKEMLDKAIKSGFVLPPGSNQAAVKTNGVERFGEDFVPYTIEQYRDLLTNLFQGKIDMPGDYNLFNKTVTQARQVWLTWLDKDFYETIEEFTDIFTPVKAIYLLDIQGEKTVLEERDVLPGYKPGEPDHPSPWFWYQWIEQQHNVMIDHWDNFNEPIAKDTEYVIYASPAQKIVSFITYSGGEWHLDVYAVNAGDTPTPPPAYDTTSGSPFTGWVGEKGNKKVFELQPIHWEALPAKREAYLYTGLKTTEPLYSVSGTFQNCYDAYYNKDLYDHINSYYEISQYLYAAEYELCYCKITINFPTTNYFDIDHSTGPIVLQEKLGDQIRMQDHWFMDGRGYEFIGIDSDGDGIADYDWRSGPIVTGDLNLNVLYKVKTNDITLLDYSGEITDNFTVNHGNKPSVLGTVPEPNPENGHIFDYWEISKNGGDFIPWKAYYTWLNWYQLMGFSTDDSDYASFTIRPVYKKDLSEYYVLFLDGTSYNIHLYLPKGTYNISDFDELVNPPRAPYKAPDEMYDYVFAGWECGDSFTVTGGEDIQVINPVFTPIPASYTIRFETPWGVLSTGNDYHEITSTYGKYTNDAAMFLTENSSFSDVLIVEKIYKFERWSGPTIDITSRTISYVAIWSDASREYAITYNAGDGSFIEAHGGGKTVTLTLPYGSTYGLLPGSSVFKTESDGKTYTFAGWRDGKGHLYSNFDENYNFEQQLTLLEDTTLTAEYTEESMVYTVTVSSGGGKFTDGTTTDKVYTGGYGEPTNIGDLGIPIKDSDAMYTYAFSGWSSDFPSTFTQNITITAQYTSSERMYTITFDANGGKFPDDKTTYTKSYSYESTIDTGEIPVPTREADTNYSYEFKGWGNLRPVTSDDSYYAVWDRTIINADLPMGIFISDGEDTEDIIKQSLGDNRVKGYAFEKDWEGIPTLTISGNDLTVSGKVNGEGIVHIKIGSSVNTLTFKDLSLTSDIEYRTLIRIEASSGEEEESQSEYEERNNPPLKIYISGNCNFGTKERGASAFFINRETHFVGERSGSLTITAESSIGIEAHSAISFMDLNLYLNAAGEIISEMSSRVFQTWANSPLSFIDSNVTITAPGCEQGPGDQNKDLTINIIGETVFIYESTNNVSALTMAKLYFTDFTGTFSIYFSNEYLAGPVITVRDKIDFIMNGNPVGPGEYGVIIGKDGKGYYTFVDSEGNPLADIEIPVRP